MIDLHAHIINTDDREMLCREIRFRRSAGIFTCYSTSSPKEWQLLADILASLDEPPQLLPYGAEMVTFGIHPWHAADVDLKDCCRLFAETLMIGEIGLDTLWCDVPYERQRRCFEKQLEIASDLKKPVVLHTKNCEEAAADMIRDFPEPVCIHWYSGDVKNLRRLIEQDCYFTFSADTQFPHDQTLSCMLREVPIERVLTETDGLDAILWAYENHGPEPSLQTAGASLFPLIPASLEASLRCLAEAHHKSCAEMQQQIDQNFLRFLQ